MEMSLIFFEFRNDFFVSSCRFEIHSQDLLEAKSARGLLFDISHAIKCHAFLIHVTLGLTMLGEKHTGNVCPDMLKTKNKLKTMKSLPKCGFIAECF